MAITTIVKSSNMRPLMAGHEFVEVELKDDAPSTAGNISAPIALGESYRSIRPVCVTPSFDTAPVTYAGLEASASVADNAGVTLLYKPGTASPLTVRATFECET